MNRSKNKVVIPIICVFLIFNGFVTIFRSFLERQGFDRDFLIVANVILFIVSIAGFFLQKKGLTNPNTQAFIRSVYLSMIIKMFVCMIAILIYILMVGNNVNKPALFTAMGLYMVYTAVEVGTLMKSVRNKNV